LRAATPLIGRTALVDARERLHLADPADAAAQLALLAWEDAIKGDEDECRCRAPEAFELATRHGSGIAYELATAVVGGRELGFGRPDEALPRFAGLWESGSDVVKLLFAPSVVEAAVRADERRLAEEAFAVLEEPALVARCRGLLSGEIASFEQAI